jgi:hypothetical protein
VVASVCPSSPRNSSRKLSGTVCANTVCDAPAVITPIRANVARMRAVVVVVLFGVI